MQWLAPIERVIYRVCGVDPEEDQHWTRYAAAVLLFSAASLLVTYAAISAVDAIDTEVRELQKLLQLNRGELSIVTQPMNLAELLRPTLAIAAARAESAHVQLRPVVSDTAPRTIVDAVLAQEALTSILIDAIAHTAAGGDVDVDAGEGDRARIRISITSRPMVAGTANAGSLEMRLARRLLEAQGCSITSDGAVTIVDMPSESTSHVTR